MLQKILFTVLISATGTNSFGQFQSTSQKNHFVTFQIGYMNSTIGKTFGSKGCISNLGFNTARFFSKTLVLGPAVDIKLNPGLGVIQYSNEFRNDFNANFILPQSSSHDSASAKVLKENINGNSIRGNSMFYYGLMFSLLPHKAGGIMIQIKTGGTAFQLRQQIFGNKFIGGGGYDKAAVSFIHCWKFDFNFKPMAFFRDAYVDIYESESPFNEFLNIITITLFYERLNFATGEFNDTPFSAFLTSEFLKKYAVDNRFGIKVGFSLY